ncbi:MAG: peptidylprolyl isomerase [Bacteroidota bacterium]
MKRKLTLILLFAILPLFGFSTDPIPDSTHDYLVTISTDYGDMKIMLHDDTPKHKKNFVKLAKAGVYDNLTFHRVIDDFMIQTGDPKTRNKPGDYDRSIIPETLPAEIRKNHKHVYGAVAAARQGDKENPERRSSGSQFYIVENSQGTPHLDGKYTVFGQVLEGYEVINKIADQPTGENDRPKEDIRMTVEVKKVKRDEMFNF